MIKYGTIIKKCTVCGKIVDEHQQELCKISSIDGHEHQWESITKEDEEIQEV